MSGGAALALGVVVAGVAPCLVGLAPLAAMYARRAIDRGTLLGLMYPVGATFFSLAMLGLGLAGVPLQRFAIAATAMVISGVTALLAWWRLAPIEVDAEATHESGSEPAPSLGVGVTAVAASLLAAKILFVFYEVSRKPIQVWDAFAVWTLRAKVWAARQSLVLDSTDPFYLGGGARADYPPHASLLHAWTAIGIGEWNDVVVNLPWAFYFVSAIVLVFGVASRLFSRQWGLLAAAGLSGLPLFVMHATHAGYADMILAVHFLAALAMGLLADADQSSARGDGRGYFVLSIGFLASLLLIKLEGVALLAAAAIGLGLREPRSRRAAARRKGVAGAVAALSVLAVLANAALRKYVASSTFHAEAVWPVLGDLFAQGNWNLLWFAFWGFFVLHFRTLRSRPSGRLGLVVALAFVPFLYVLLSTDAWLFAMNQTADSRLFLSLAPAALLYVVIASAELCHEPAKRWR